MASNQISRLFSCDTFFFNSALFSFFVFLSSFRFSFVLLYIFQHYYKMFYCFEVYFKCSMQRVRHESQTLLAVSVFESIASLSTFSLLAVSVSESVSSASVPEPFETNMTNGWGSMSVAMSRMRVSTINSRFAKCMIKRKKCFRTTKKI